VLTSLLIGFKILFKKIGEKEEFEHKKHYEKFNNNYCPQSFTNGHGFESIVIEVKYFCN